MSKIRQRQAADSVQSSKRAKRFLLFALLVCLLMLALAEPTLAQCVMCRASLTTNSNFIKHFNIGVLVLLVPPVSMFIVIFAIAIRNRKS